jgi:hypothetical protein
MNLDNLDKPTLSWVLEKVENLITNQSPNPLESLRYILTACIMENKK